MLHYATELSTLLQYGKMRAHIEEVNILLIYVQPKIYAIADQCPHEGVSLYDHGKMDATCITCKAHHAKIDITTGEIINQAHILFVKMKTPRAQVYSVVVNDQKVFVNLPTKKEVKANE